MNIMIALYANICYAVNIIASRVVLSVNSMPETEGSPDAMSQILVKVVIALVIGLLGGLIYAMILKGELTSVYKNDTAADYKKQGSFKVELSRELFMYSKTEKREKPQPQDAPPQGKR